MNRDYCPYLGTVFDAATRFDHPDEAAQCYAFLRAPFLPPLDHQAHYCLRPAYPTCPRLTRAQPPEREPPSLSQARVAAPAAPPSPQEGLSPGVSPSETAAPTLQLKLPEAHPAVSAWPEAQAEGRGHPWLRAAATPLLLLVGTLAIAAPLLDFDPHTIPWGLDYDSSAVTLAFERQALLEYHQFPLWNPTYFMGLPHLADPFTTLLYPIAFIPTLLLGAVLGPKLAIALSIWLAGVGQWFLCRTLALPRVVCLWSGLLFIFSGNLAARFFSGHPQKILGYPWVPLTIAFTILALQRPQRRYPVLAALSLAMFVFAGDLPNLLYLVLPLMVLGLFLLVQDQGEPPKGLGPWRPLLVLGFIGVEGFLLAGVRLLPIFELQPVLVKIGGALLGTQEPLWSLLNFLISEREFWVVAQRKVLNIFWGWWEYYSYLGLWPFLTIPFFVLFPGRRGLGWALLLMAAVVLYVWAGLAFSPLAGVYEKLPFLGGFRVHSRSLGVVTSLIIALSSMGLAFLWGRARELQDRPQRWLVMGLLGAFMVVSLADPFLANGNIYGMKPSYVDTEADQVLGWLRQRDPSVYYVAIEPSAPEPRIAQLGVVSYGMRLLNPYYGWRLKGYLDTGVDMSKERYGAQIAPKYIITMTQREPSRSYEVIRQFPNYTVFQAKLYFPYAFVTGRDRFDFFKESGDPNKDALEVTPLRYTPHEIEFRVEAKEAGKRLVVLESAYPGWKVVVDGQRELPAQDLSDFLAVALEPGEHHYRFVFDPWSAKLGLALSLLGLLVALAFLWGGRRRQ